MPKEATAGSNQSGLVYLKYTFRYRSKFDEPNDDWLDAIEATSDDLLGAYSRKEDEAMTVAFGARGKRRLNRVFYVIGFIYHDYSFPARRQGGKRKVATSASSSAPKAKRAKVLTRRPKPIETAEVPKLNESEEAASLVIEISPAMPIEASVGLVKEPESETAAEHPKVLSPLAAIGLPKPTSITTSTPRKRKMASILDVVLESMEAPVSASAEASGETSGVAKEATTASMANVLTEAGPSEATPTGLVEENAPEKSKSLAPETPPHGNLEFIVRHASVKQISLEQIA
jgi:hypothetical protein